MKKLVAGLLSIFVVLSFAGCSQKASSDYPVKAAGAELSVKPTKVIALSNATKSLIEYMGQGELIVSGDFGSSTEPDIDSIIAAEPDLVITTSAFSSTAVEKIKNIGGQVAYMPIPNSFAGLKEYYVAAGSLLNGAITGREYALSVFSDIEESFNNISEFLKDREKYTAVMMLEHGYAAAENCFAGSILSYCNAENLAGKDFSLSDERLISLNPDTIYVPLGYKKTILSNTAFSNLSAVKNNRVIEVNIKGLNQAGKDFLNTVYEMLEQRYPDFINNSEKAEE